MKVSSCQSQAQYLKCIFSELETYKDSLDFDLFCCALITLANSLSHSNLDPEILDLKDSSELPEKLKEISKDLAFYIQHLSLEKKCRGNHSFQMDFKEFKNKKKAEEAARKEQLRLNANTDVSQTSYKIKSSGFWCWVGFDTYKIQSSIKYVNNSSLCSCPAIKKSSVRKLYVNEFLNDLDCFLKIHEIDREKTWMKIILLLLQPD